MASVKNRLKELVAIKERNESVLLSIRRLAKDTGIGESSVANWMSNRVTRYDEKQIVVFCRYFGCTINDLLVIVDEDSPQLEMVA